MSYNSKALSVLAYANGFTLWHYRTNDNPEQLLTDGYFDGAFDMLRVGDVVIVSTDAGGVFLSVASNDRKRVTVRTAPAGSPAVTSPDLI